LIGRGARIDVTDTAGRAPVQIARICGRQAIYEILSNEAARRKR
jgi:hypothetical protein